MYRFFADESTEGAIELLASSERVTLFVGAGSSKEVGLPTWAELIDRLADRAIDDVADEHRPALKAFIGDSGLLTAAERIQRSLRSEDIDAEIRKAIYGDDDPRAVVPGPLTRATAKLKAQCEGVRLVTTNYDQLILTALRAEGRTGANSYCLDTNVDDAVIHLHGVLGYEEPGEGVNEVILTEHDFLAPAGGEWRADVVSGALADTSCVFLGASLTDLNLLAPLHRSAPSGTPRHVVVFVRNPALDPQAQARAEKIDRARWGALGVRVVFADNYGDVAQFVDEIRLKRLDARSYEPLPRRLAHWHDSTITTLVPDDLVDLYRQIQEQLVQQLDVLLDSIQGGYLLDGEIMQLGLFGLGCDERERTDFAIVLATSDRVMRDPRSYERLPLERSTRWLGVRAMTGGTPVAEPRDDYASRWKYMLGVPIFLDEPLHACAGSVVLSSTAHSSKLSEIGGNNGLRLEEYEELYDALESAGRIVLST